MTSTPRTILVLGKNINARDPAAAQRIHEFSDLLGQYPSVLFLKRNKSNEILKIYNDENYNSIFLSKYQSGLFLSSINNNKLRRRQVRIFVNVNHHYHHHHYHYPPISADLIITSVECAYTRHSNKARQLLYSKRIAYDLYYLTTCRFAPI
ncbi:hypothetical protein V1477_018344 [Vespula maculifrons]|uniref:Uncharacterized protein n=1 Tax=Vespula maculifrons TaxID=7453 RepID=A0ABD2AZ66_VESMC